MPTDEFLFEVADAPVDVEDRVLLVHDALFDHVCARETQFRLFHRAQVLASLEQGRGDRALRPGFRVALLDAALMPAAELGQGRMDRLEHALAVLIATEAVIGARDVLQLDHDTARDHLRWSCRLPVRAAGADAAGALGPTTAGRAGGASCTT